MLHNPLSPKGRVMAEMDHVATSRFVNELLRIGHVRIGEGFGRYEIAKPKAYILWQRDIPADVKLGIYNLILEEYPEIDADEAKDEILLAAQDAARFVAENLSNSLSREPVNFIRKENIGKFMEIVESIGFSIEFSSLRAKPFLIFPKIPLKDEIAILSRRKGQAMARIATNMSRLADILIGKHFLAIMENNYFMFRSAALIGGDYLQVIVDPDLPKVSVNYITKKALPFPVDVTDIISDPERMAEEIRARVGLEDARPKNEESEAPACRP